MRRGRRIGIALVCSASALSGAACLDPFGNAGPQGWSASEQQAWYGATQGSRLIPLAWAKALEGPGDTRPFFASANLEGFGFIRREPAAGHGLPVGFSVDDSDDDKLKVTRLRWYEGQGGGEAWVGLTCAACHTGQITHGGATLTVDGAPSLLDFQSFVEATDAALKQTAADPAKWERFAAVVLAGKDDDANRAKLKAELARLIAWEDRVEALNSTPLRYGFARVDAFGHIYNKVVLYVGAADPVVNPADAPVSYPFLWDISDHKKLQWNGIAQNRRLSLGWGRYLDYGALGRNSGEVIGVFGEVAPTATAGVGGYKSSIRSDNLERIETQLAKLKAPKWPVDMLGPIDTQKAAIGQVLFADHCDGCHKLKSTVKAGEDFEVMIRFDKLAPENRTDPWMACNAFTYTARTGVLKGVKNGYVGDGQPFADEAPVASLLETVVKGALVGDKGEIVGSVARTFLGIRPRPSIEEDSELPPEERKQLRREICETTDDDLLAYKARPLDGVWATAPYLHNGSVPTLYDLLLPADARPKSFLVGTREYDPVKVGYSADGDGNIFRFETAGPDGAPIDGNSNAGHDYGAARMSEEERWALVEYLKTL